MGVRMSELSGNSIDIAFTIGSSEPDAKLLKMRRKKQIMHRISHTFTRQLHNGLLACPKARELQVGLSGTEDKLLLIGVHGITDEVGTCRADALYIDTYGMVGESTEDGGATMAEVEMDLRIVLQKWLAMLGVGERGNLGKTIFLP